MEGSRTVTMLFDGMSVDVTRSVDAGFDDFLIPALQLFKIPLELKDFFQVLSGHKHLYGKEAFDRYVQLYPDCDFVFELRMNILTMSERVSNDDGQLLIKPILAEKRILNLDGDLTAIVSTPKRFKANTEEFMTML